MAGIYKPKEKRTAQLSARVTPTIKRGLNDLARLYTHIDRTRFKDDEIVWTEADVLEQVLAQGIDAAWDEAGGVWPETEAEWSEVLKKAEKALDPRRKK